MAGRLPADRPDETVIVAKDISTNPEYGFTDLEALPIEFLLNNSIINLDKPSGPTSHEVATWVRKIIGSDRVGHGGTLDPGVTGVLPMGIGEGTKVMQALLPAGKEYICLMELHGPVDDDELQSVIQQFVGKIYQKPPLRSSVKRVLRVREVYYIDIIERKGRFVLFRVGCQAGTYIRKLCYDIGEAIGHGAHMRELRRTRVGRLIEDEHMCTLYDLKDAYQFYKEDGDETELRRYLRTIEHALGHLPLIKVRDSAVDAICHGADLAASGVVELSSDIKKGDLVALKTLKSEGIAIARSEHPTSKISTMKSGIVAKIERVFMERGRYPSMWKKKES